MACEKIKAKLDALIGQSNDINQELQNTRDPSEIAALRSALSKLVPQILSTQRLLADCLNQVAFPGSPAVLIDMNLPDGVSIDINNPKVSALQGLIQQELAPLSASLAPLSKLLVGPNFVLATDSLGHPLLRIGIWIEDPTFPALIPASPPDFPLPRLSAQSASAGFNAADFLPVPEAGLLPFALSIPVTTFQSILDAIFPTLQVAASKQGLSLKSATVQTNRPDTVKAQFDGDLPLTSFSATFTEVLGTQQLPDSVQTVPAVIKSDFSTSVGDLFNWVVGAFFPLYGAVLLGVWGVASSVAGGISDKITGTVGSFIARLPPRIPCRNTMFPSGFHVADFPALVFNWKAFGATDSGIFADGAISIEARDQNEVALTVSGSGLITGPQNELAGGADQTYSFSLVNLAPDPDKFGWQVSGKGSDEGSIDRTPLSQAGDFGVDFPLPFNVAPGNFPFTLAVNATETCGSDPSKTLSSSFSKKVEVRVTKNPTNPP